jgi:hypothetical protein
MDNIWWRDESKKRARRMDCVVCDHVRHVENAHRLLSSYRLDTFQCLATLRWRFAYKAVCLQIVQHNREEMKRKAVSQGLLVLRQSKRYTMVQNAPKCAICMETERSIAFDCGHVVCCQRCGADTEDCPICRSKIAIRMKIYLS